MDFAALTHIPVRLENIDDADVDQQPLSFAIASRNTTHAARSQKEQLIHSPLFHSYNFPSKQIQADTGVLMVTLTDLLNPKLPSLEPPPGWTPWRCNTDFSGLVVGADLGSLLLQTPYCRPNCLHYAPFLCWPGPCCGCPSTDCNP